MQGLGTVSTTGKSVPAGLRARGLGFGTYVLGALCALGGFACRSTEPAEPEGEEVTLEQFRDLISQGGVVEPTTSAAVTGPGGLPQDDDAFDVAAERYEDGFSELPIEPLGPPENPYLEFGKRIQVYPDGRITKPYPLRVGTGAKLESMLRSYGGFPIYNPETGPQGTDTVRMDLQEGWDIELYTNLRDANIKPATPIPLADWLVVTAVPELMREVESFINIFAASVPQIEIEAKIVEVRTFDSLDVGVTQNGDTPIFDFPDGTAVDFFTYDFPIATPGASLAVGAVQDGTAINAVLEALALFENVSIISRPTIAVREGGRAEIVTVNRLPFLNVTGVNANSQPNLSLTYEEVGVKLYVVPRVVGTETVALNIDVEASQQAGSSVIFAGSAEANAITSPIISRRSARTTVYLEPGQAVILGGLITERMVEQEDKVPILGDIPLLGYLFRSTFTSKENANVLFFIRPRILEGTDLNREF